MTARVALALEGISKRFGATDALRDALLTVRPGTIHALLGENGAGKTTLMRVAYGLVQPDAGTVRIANGPPLRLSNPAAAIRAGIGMVHQHFTVVHAMTVAENVALGGHGRFDRDASAARVREIAATIGVTLDPGARAGSLSLPAQQQLEIVKALSRDGSVLILDEPTAVLAPLEVEQLMSRLRALASRGLAVILITHKLREALAVADDVTVLRRGSTVLQASARDVSEHELATAMLGATWNVQHPAGVIETVTPISPKCDAHPESPFADADLVARARGIVVLDERGQQRVRGVDFDVFRGEIVGIAGVEGSGVRELLRALAGRTRVTGGRLEQRGTVGFVPEDRHHEAIALDLTLTENVALRGAGARRGFSRWRARREHTRSLIEQFDVRAPTWEVAIGDLSGGNQQKLVLARELDGAPTLLVAENPTRGLDLRATSAVHARLRAARDAGMAVVIYSSDLDELIALSDRTCAMFAGALIETPRERQAIGAAMLGASAG